MIHSGRGLQLHKGRYHTLKQNGKEMVFLESCAALRAAACSGPGTRPGVLAKKQLSLLTYGNHLVTILETRWLHLKDT